MWGRSTERSDLLHDEPDEMGAARCSTQPNTQESDPRRWIGHLSPESARRVGDIAGWLQGFQGTPCRQWLRTRMAEAAQPAIRELVHLLDHGGHFRRTLRDGELWLAVVRESPDVRAE